MRLMPSISEPAFGVGSFETVEEIGLELVQAGEHLGVDVEHWAADAGVLMVAGGAVGAAAVGELDLAVVEVGLELGPFLVGGRPVLVGRTLGASSVEGTLVVADEIFVADRDVAAITVSA